MVTLTIFIGETLGSIKNYESISKITVVFPQEFCELLEMP